MDIDQKYNQVISELKQGKRPYFKLSKEDFNFLHDYLDQSLTDDKPSNTKKVLCLLEVCANHAPVFDELLYKVLDQYKEKDMTIFCLGVIQKQIIDRHTKEGERPSSKLFNYLKELLKHPAPEVVEWSLRTIEGLGPMSYSLKEEILAAKPSVFGSLNPHKKASRQIVDLILKNWKAYGIRI